MKLHSFLDFDYGKLGPVAVLGPVDPDLVPVTPDFEAGRRSFVHEALCPLDYV